MEVISEVSASAIQQAVGSVISAGNIVKLTNLAQVVRCPPGQYLFREGQAHGELYILLDGKVDLLMTIPGRGPQRILTIGSGELLAWSAMVGGRDHANDLRQTGSEPGATGDAVMTCDAVATNSSTLLQLNGQQLRSLFTTEPQLGYEFMLWLAKGVSKRLTATRLQLLDLFAHENRR